MLDCSNFCFYHIKLHWHAHIKKKILSKKVAYFLSGCKRNKWVFFKTPVLSLLIDVSIGSNEFWLSEVHCENYFSKHTESSMTGVHKVS